jgi:hypothetical protein
VQNVHPLGLVEGKLPHRDVTTTVGLTGVSHDITPQRWIADLSFRSPLLRGHGRRGRRVILLSQRRYRGSTGGGPTIVTDVLDHNVTLADSSETILTLPGHRRAPGPLRGARG